MPHKVARFRPPAVQSARVATDRWSPVGGRSMARVSLFAVFFWGLCFSRFPGAAGPASIPAATPQQVHKTVERSIGYLQTESAAWLNQRKCAACHHVPMPLWALNEAGKQGYAIDKKYVAATIES